MSGVDPPEAEGWGWTFGFDPGAGPDTWSCSFVLQGFRVTVGPVAGHAAPHRVQVEGPETWPISATWGGAGTVREAVAWAGRVIQAATLVPVGGPALAFLERFAAGIDGPPGGLPPRGPGTPGHPAGGGQP